jgi:molecular chaperone DnaK (HSP70)
VACADRGNYPVIDFTDSAGDAVGWIPSAVAERDGELRFGFDATAVADDPSFTVLRSFKRLLSNPKGGPGDLVRLGQTALPVSELVTRFLSHVRESILARVHPRRGKARAEGLKAVVAVPANAHSAQRFVTLDAFRRAGFEVLTMLNEPSAAGFEYTHRHRETLSARRDLVMVYDLGGGTFDASLVRVTGLRHEVLATAGVTRLGGDDFDAVLAMTALAQVGMDLDSLPERAASALLTQCLEQKERIHPNSKKLTIDLDALLGRDAPRPELTLSVADFYDACLPLVEETIDAMVSVMSRAAVGNEAPDLAEVAGIYVVGGASELPIVARTLRDRFGRRVHRSPYPSAAVAIGLAIAADDGAGFLLSDRYARTFGVFREAAAGREITFDPIFTKETELPRSASEPLTSTRVYRAAHNVGHFRFFECGEMDEEGKPRGDMALFGDVYFPFDARLVGSSDLSSIPVERAGEEGPRILERYSLDDHGIVEVLIRNLDSGHERAFRLGA